MKHESIINKLTLHQKALLMSGKGHWTTWDFEEKGVPSIFLSDGPHGVRKQVGEGDHLGLNASIPATSFPTAATLANSWNIDLIEKVGFSLGREAEELGVQVILGPGMNIKRNPLAGRNFEYFSEDPFLTGKLASAYVKGIQSNRVAASPKHFAANNQELRRMSVDSVVDERALREIYLRAFEIVVKESQPLFMMTAYNSLNGEYANENHHLLQDILYGEWGYKGAIVTDWGGSSDHVKGVIEGSHLEMPNTGYPGALQIIKAIEDGRMSEEILDQRVDELLNVILKISTDNSGAGHLKESTIVEHNEIAYRAAQESIVLLKNNNKILPIKSNTSVAIIGDFASRPRYQGAGSSVVNPTKLESVLDVKNQYNWGDVPYAKGFERNGSKNESLLREAVDLAQSVDKVVVFVGLTEIAESEGIDRTHMDLDENQLQLIKELRKVNEDIIVVLSGGSVVELPFVDDVQGIIHTYLSGQAGARATLDVLTGRVNPSGKLNETYPIKYSNVPNANYFPGLERTAEYRESLFVGYRYYETVNKDVRYPFGYGLSYTTFKYSELDATKDAVTFKITNTGNVSGAEVPQLYVNKLSDSIFRASKTLAGFTKIYLEPGETKVIIIPLERSSFEYFNVLTDEWEVEPGEYTIMVGSNVNTIHLSDKVYLEGTTAEAGYDRGKLEAYFIGDIRTVEDKAFESLLERPIPEMHWDKKAPLTLNDSISQLYYAKSPLARFVYKVLTYFMNRSVNKGEPNLNLYFNYNMTFRAISKMTGGLINQKMVEKILEIVNGKFFKGFGGLMKETVNNIRVNREGKKYNESI